MDTAFQERVARISAKPKPGKRNTGSLPMDANGCRILPRPLGGKRADKLENALALLNDAGKKGQWAYPALFQLLAKKGLIIKPYHFWNMPLLFIIQTFLTAAFIYAFILFILPLLPAAPRAIIDFAGASLGTQMAIVMIIGFLGTLHYLFRAKKHNLPPWERL